MFEKQLLFFTDTVQIIVYLVENTRIHPAIDTSLQPLTMEAAKEIANVGERTFALAVLSRPHLLIYFEPCTFDGGGKGKTLPDFFVVNTRNPASLGTFIEVTQGLSLTYTRKQKQLRIMKAVEFDDPTIRYLQFNGAVLANLQKYLLREKIITTPHPKLTERSTTKIETARLVKRKAG